MATNVFFNNFDSYAEKNLIEDLIIESIKMYGHDVYYSPRQLVAIDSTFNEDRISRYVNTYLVEMYIKNIEGFEGEGDFLSKFGVQIRDEITFSIAQRVFNNEIGAIEIQSRPREGDLIYLPLTNRVYQVKFVEHEAVFYQMGGLQTYDIRCELFEYSNEELSTGLDAIDSIQKQYSLDAGILDRGDLYANGDIIIDVDTGRIQNANTSFISTDPFADNVTLETDGDNIIDFSETNPFSEGNI